MWYGYVRSPVDQDGSLEIEGYEGETTTRDFTKLSQHYGFSSSPAAGEEVHLEEISGELVIVGGCAESRPSLEEGQVKMWDNEGSYVFLKNSSDGVTINAAGDLIIQADDTGSISTVGNLSISSNGNASISAGDLVSIGADSMVYTTVNTSLGSAAATEAMIKGTTFITALWGILSDWSSAAKILAGSQGGASDVLTYAADLVTALDALVVVTSPATSTSLSVKHKLDA